MRRSRYSTPGTSTRTCGPDTSIPRASRSSSRLRRVARLTRTPGDHGLAFNSESRCGLRKAVFSLLLAHYTRSHLSTIPQSIVAVQYVAHIHAAIQPACAHQQPSPNHQTPPPLRTPIEKATPRHPVRHAARPTYCLAHPTNPLHGSATIFDTSSISATDHPFAHHRSLAG